MSQPAQDPEQQPRFTAEHIYLLIAVAAGSAVALAWVAHLGGDLGGDTFDVLRAITVVAGCGYLVRSAESRMTRRLDRQAADSDERYEEGFAAGYVAHAAGQPATPPANRLRSVTGQVST